LARFWRGTRVVTTPNFAGESRLIAAAMLAMPLIQQAAQGLATRVANGVSGFLSSTDNAASGQNVPSSAPSSSATSAQPPSASTLSNSVTSALLQLQDTTDSGQIHGHHHHHGAGKYKAASDLASQLTDTTGQSGSTSAATPATTAVTA
jgi:hypothetical protein